MTSVKGAGYSSYGRNKSFDPMSRMQQEQQKKGGGRSTEDMCRALERKVNEILEESCEAGVEGETERALDLAKEARKKERQLMKQREEAALYEQLNQDLTFSVAFNLAHKYQLNGNDQEALQAYTMIVRSSNQFPQAVRLRVNIGNIYYEQGKYPHAVKNYRMALDQLPSASRALRFAITRNIGCAFLCQGYYNDATNNFEMIMENEPDVQTGLNLVVCYRILGNREKMKVAFSRLSRAQPPYDPEEEEEDDDAADLTDADHGPISRDDGLREELKRREEDARRKLLTAGRLIAPEIGGNYGPEAGFDWVASQARSDGREELASELELEKALHLLRKKEFERAVLCLKEFERKGEPFRSRAACNLAFIYLLEGETQSAEAYADLAIRADRYSAKALNNRGIVLYKQGDTEGAKAMFLEAVGVEADSAESIYDLGLAHKTAGEYQRALEAFRKLVFLQPSSPEGLLQVGDCLAEVGSSEDSLNWLESACSAVPSDPALLAKLGSVYNKLGDEARALHSYAEAHRLFPADLDVASWLGAYYVRSEMYEKAMPYFDLASKAQPREPKWRLMLASCLRRTGRYQEALDEYRAIDEGWPDNPECLRSAYQVASDLNLPDEASRYAQRLRRVEAESFAHQQESGSETEGEGLLPEPNSEPSANGKPPRRARPKENDDDVFGDAPLGDDLLPGA